MKYIIGMQAISKSYSLGGTAIPALKSIDFKMKPGEFTALQGPSGSGKSTLLNLCGLVDSADTGAYVLMGERVKHLSQRRLTELRREHIGFIFQGFNLVPVMNVAENVAYPLLLTGMPSKQRLTTVDMMLEQVGLLAFRRHRPDQLSGGQRQRVAVARALVKSPQLVIADEPTANLDGETAAQIIDLMHAMAKASRCTFLIATHDERMAARCDRVLRLVDGRLK